MIGILRALMLVYYQKREPSAGVAVAHLGGVKRPTGGWLGFPSRLRGELASIEDAGVTLAPRIIFPRLFL